MLALIHRYSFCRFSYAWTLDGFKTSCFDFTSIGALPGASKRFGVLPRASMRFDKRARPSMRSDKHTSPRASHSLFSLQSKKRLVLAAMDMRLRVGVTVYAKFSC